MFCQVPFYFSFRFNGSIIFNNNIGRCFRRFISVSSIYNNCVKTNSVSNFLFPKKQGEVFNFRSVQSAVKMVNETKSDSAIRISDYDCIGFDLDNTLCLYNLNPLIQMEYNALVSYLCEFRGYPQDRLKAPLQQSDMDFLQRGLMLDLKKGNILKVNLNGSILKARHGTKEMSEDEIKLVYGEAKKWVVTDSFCENMISTWNGPLATELRPLLDFFDISASLVFARIVDYADESEAQRSESYAAGEDILAALVQSYKRDHYQSEKSKFFHDMKMNQSEYTLKCDTTVIDWLKQLKSENKVTFLLTGSNVDFASFSAKYCLGEYWRDLFDIVICYARKPGFFMSNLPFISLNGYNESCPIKSQDLARGNIYSQGNWKDLIIFFSKMTGKENPKCLYFGDNVVQDVYTPSRFCGCDTVAVIEELNSESPSGDSLPWLKSNKWGSYFKYNDDPTVWGNAIRNYSKICIPSVNYIAKLPLNYEFQTFSNNKCGDVAGFHPVTPASLKQTQSN